MKQIWILFLAVLVTVTQTKAQSIDGDFEQFVTKTLYSKPQGYKTSNAYTFPVDGQVNVTQVTNGVRLTNIENECGIVPGVLILGGFGPNGVDKFPMSKKPDGIEFTYKTGPGYSAILDSAKVIAIQFAGDDISRVAGGLENIQAAPLGRTFTFNFLDLPDAPTNVDSMLIVAVSSITSTPDVGEWVEFYNFRLVGSEIGVTDTLPNSDLSRFETLSYEEVGGGWTTDNVIHYPAFSELVASRTNDAAVNNNAVKLRTALTAASEFELSFNLAEIGDIDEIDFDTTDFIDTVGTMFYGSYTGCKEYGGGLSIATYPTSIQGKYKYRSGETGGSGDVGLITLIFTNGGNESFRREFELNEASAYTDFKFDIVPDNQFAAEKVIVVVQSSDFRDTVRVEIGSELTLDGIELVTEEKVDAGDDQLLCAFSPIALGGNPTYVGGASSVSYSWEPAALLNNPTSANPTLKANAFDGGLSQIFVLTVTADGSQITDQVIVTLAATVDLPATIEGLCVGTDATLNALQYSEVEATGTPVYNWDINGAVSNGATANFTVQASNSVSLSVEIAGCTVSDQATIAGTEVTVDAGADQEVCEGANFTLTATGNGSSFSWNPATDLSSPNSATTTGKATETTTFTVVSQLDGCTASDEVTVTVNALPEASISIASTSGGTLCIGQEAELSLDGTFADYNWSTGSTDATAVITITEEVNESVVITDDNNCVNTILFIQNYSPCVGLDELENAIVAFPNPFTSTITIQDVPANAVVSVYSVTGTLQYQAVQASQTDLSLGENLNAGMYILTIETETGVSTLSIVKK